jgi:hypothetical protein
MENKDKGSPWILVWWFITFRVYKVVVAEYWERKGMYHAFAYEEAKKTTRVEYKSSTYKAELLKMIEAEKHGNQTTKR